MVLDVGLADNGQKAAEITLFEVMVLGLPISFTVKFGLILNSVEKKTKRESESLGK